MQPISLNSLVRFALQASFLVVLACGSAQTAGSKSPCAASTTTQFDPIHGCCGEGPMQLAAKERHSADYEIARLDTAKTDWSVYAHHPNVYVRGLSLTRLRDRHIPLTMEQAERVAQLLDDSSPIYSADCADLLTSCAQGQGLDMMRGNCMQHAVTVSGLADEVLQSTDPKTVIHAIVTHLAEPALSDLTQGRRDDGPRAERLRAAAKDLPDSLIDAVMNALPKIKDAARLRLYKALTLGPLGGKNPQLLAILVSSLKAKDPNEIAAAATAILRLTDAPGPTALPASEEPRKSAASSLIALYRERRISLARQGLGSAAAPLLDEVMEHVRRLLSESRPTLRAAEEIVVIEQMGPRAARTASLLIELGSKLASDDDTRADYDRATITHTLAAIGAPVADLKRFALRHAASRDGFVAATAALISAKVRLTAEEFALLQSSSVQCKVPIHPRAFDGSWNDCVQANEDLNTLERWVRSEPPNSRVRDLTSE